MVQHYELTQLNVKDSKGNPLGCDGNLDIGAWPKTMSLTADLSPSFTYVNGRCQGVSGAGLCVVDRPLVIPSTAGMEPKKLTVECWVKIPSAMSTVGARGWLLCKNGNEWVNGNYGFSYDRSGVAAVMNIGGGKANERRIPQHGHLISREVWHQLALSYDGQLAVVSGMYDQIRVWDRALSPAVIAEHAANPSQLKDRTGLTFDKSFGNDAVPGDVAPNWKNAELSISLNDGTHHWQQQKRFTGDWTLGQKHQLTLTCDFTKHASIDHAITVRVSTPDKQVFPVQFSKPYDCFVSHIAGLHRSWKAGYTDIRNYDEFIVDVDNPSSQIQRVPFLLYFSNTANITVLCPILCQPNGVPTGIFVQLSKN